jgi:hypothetical protein
MGIPANVAKHVISGTMPTGEIFQTAFWIGGAAAPSISDASEQSFAANTQMQAVFTAMKAIMGSGTVITALDGYGYTGGGGATSHGHAPLNIPGTSATPHPNQCALVVTLRTAVSSRNARGRMYFPATGIQMPAGGGPAATGSQNALVDAVAALATWAGGTNPMVVVSQTLTATHPVTSVSADNIVDTQRRRRNKLIGTTYSKTV